MSNTATPCVCVCVCVCGGSRTAEAPFSQWSNEQVCGWLQAQGLGMYVAQGQEWIRSGQTLLQATQHEVEKVGSWLTANRTDAFKGPPLLYYTARCERD